MKQNSQQRATIDFPPHFQQTGSDVEPRIGGVEGGGTIYATNRGTKAARTCAAGRGTSRSQADLEGTMSQTRARGGKQRRDAPAPKYPLQSIDLDLRATTISASVEIDLLEKRI